LPQQTKEPPTVLGSEDLRFTLFWRIGVKLLNLLMET
jgi:hypothetical protein